ncbi:MAG: hypothetical protein J6S76_06180 [Clostridia bacterium]|nr:hypothetical protein [Clostridia bacterium]
MKKVKTVILAGQSNAVGVGWCKYLPKSYDAAEIARFKDGYENVLINYHSHDFRSDGFVPTRVNCTQKDWDTLGPEVGIAQRWTELYPDEPLYIVKCAVGGTNMYFDWLSPSEWANLPATPENANVGWLYKHFVTLMDESIAILAEQGCEPDVIGFFWMQGESDAFLEEQHLNYERRYKAMLDDIRAAYGKYMEHCRFVDAGISDSVLWKFYAEVNEVKRAMAEKTPSFVYIDTIAAGLTTLNEPEDAPDIAHYDCESTVKLGRLFVDAL